MNDAAFSVNDAASLENAIKQRASSIEVEGRIADLSSLKLPAGANLRGAGPGAELHFKPGQPGLMLSSNHHVSSLRLVTDEAQIASGLFDDRMTLARWRSATWTPLAVSILRPARQRRAISS